MLSIICQLLSLMNDVETSYYSWSPFSCNISILFWFWVKRTHTWAHLCDSRSYRKCEMMGIPNAPARFWSHWTENPHDLLCSQFLEEKSKVCSTPPTDLLIRILNVCLLLVVLCSGWYMPPKSFKPHIILYCLYFIDEEIEYLNWNNLKCQFPL